MSWELSTAAAVKGGCYNIGSLYARFSADSQRCLFRCRDLWCSKVERRNHSSHLQVTWEKNRCSAVDKTSLLNFWWMYIFQRFCSRPSRCFFSYVDKIQSAWIQTADKWAQNKVKLTGHVTATRAETTAIRQSRIRPYNSFLWIWKTKMACNISSWRSLHKRNIERKWRIILRTTLIFSNWSNFSGSKHRQGLACSCSHLWRWCAQESVVRLRPPPY